MSYNVKFINDKDFDALPYKKSLDALGVADKNNMIAYVRDTGNPMDIFTAYHELEHLKGDNLDELEDPNEPGVFYKDKGGIVKTIATIGASLIPGIGPIAGPAVAGGFALNDAHKASKQASSQQQGAMSQFQSQGMPQVQQAASPNVIQTGMSGGDMGGGSGQGGSLRSDMELARTALDRSKGFYSGRNAGGF